MPHSPMPTRDSLREVRYDIRGELSRRARELEGQGRHLIRLNIGNPGAFGFRAPDHLQQALSAHVAESDAYTHQQGLPLAREAVAQAHRERGTPNACAERVFVGNGVSELIDMSLRALLNPGDEVLLPSPDYPLWSAATILNQGRPVYYRCAPENGFLPDPDEIEKLVTPRTALAPLAGDVPCLSFGGLSKVWRACGWRVGWAVLSGDPLRVGDFHHALDLLSAMRLCANVPGQFAVPAALQGPETIRALTVPGGRLFESRQAVIDGCAASEHLSVVAPMGALYAFPQVVGPAADGFDDQAFALELLENEDVLVVPGSGFNVPGSRHFRITLLPEAPVVREVFERIDRVLSARAGQRKRHVA